jgi:hypothetical protein
MFQGGIYDGREVAGQELLQVSVADQLACECNDPACTCNGACDAWAAYEWGSVEAGEWQYLCARCTERMLARGTAPELARGEEAPPA